MSKVVLVTGPARSGKSEWAEILAMQSQKAVIYVATAVENSEDKEWQQRILQHKQRRPQHWATLEVPYELSATFANAEPNICLLVDSLGTWVANFLEQDELIWENIVQEFLETVELVSADVIFVAEETGWGVVPAYPIGRTFRDRLGHLVRQLAGISQEVYLVTGGHVLNLSLLGSPLPKLKNSHRNRKVTNS
ncbi:bifunctional adenosylcobinamide kinase/adenosylcobinamide-phosphate guanylyltransferase [Brasilonema octagenarum UFV-E1]|uniref:Adenosylcobinamide kinase n=1 Tax=Brasilonema sennae CENA114 TaxID=415709 RepID=A0A856MEM7_9CYAN|nr:bifunctional adenosylcobinamide kinase/adenosylcobinamide-phosphate guanylyltransferase [Brasilonema sennae]QDL07517.1 bifunctional adenosylcobinamide kinase/adenosylcobinamide-phosphate guanylyltransferase [Brasilonema sennae CENA114]QDL13879.1 bifunctional adenosylcobinamide kinase/adenosylcobinamide-phosphate guanylyltransferase [Brasilonema octagenarum UFV-E1]